ncbi:secreted RxLR effector protein 161-like [Rutidosis leptorrhynchoides]|uniref:secreted RxLR effector protein 161-like n=1 Tax=Rutidosis leptorrhynchoides TaxID=125765 RepID=UPI003A99AE91
MIDCKAAETPAIPSQKLFIEEGAELANQEQYQRIVGKLIYLAHTRPYIAYAVEVVSQFMHHPQAHHMDAVWRIIRYLKGTTGHGVVFKNNGHLNTQIYIDASWGGEKGDRKSTSGYFTSVGGNLVTCKSKKQKVVALSSAEAEFRGIARGVQEALWIRKLLTEIGFPPEDTSKIFLHFIKEKLKAEIISLPFVRSEDQLADILTKSVNGRLFNEVLVKLNIENLTIQLEGEC